MRSVMEAGSTELSSLGCSELFALLMIGRGREMRLISLLRNVHLIGYDIVHFRYESGSLKTRISNVVMITLL